jgi:hypothetical protein
MTFYKENVRRMFQSKKRYQFICFEEVIRLLAWAAGKWLFLILDGLARRNLLANGC